ncbi:MAG: hypothetical protein ABF780_08235 [Bifidobacterium aquikefiri]|uniref:Uncharacterized protein n=1 Tax=Bifidobacterium aquikefiri TaxID=1653207 RepID=A0A261G779_9BIFI|nr:hypothetical protein [Bifidobacterium aquikefiri]OZG67268.1 hypothetical protein BAQU_1341 [Bifidobacterium aquikefiri]
MNEEPANQEPADRTEKAGDAATPSPDDTSARQETPSSKEARYRIRAREAESQVQTLRQSLTAARRAMLNNASANGHVIDPKAARDLYEGMDESAVDALFTEQSAVDADRFDAFIASQIEEKPYLRDARPQAPIAFGVDHQPEPRRGNAWSQAFGQGQ